MGNAEFSDELRGFFGRRVGRPIRPARKKLLSELLPQLALKVTNDIDPAALFPNADEVWMEIGFGDGEHLAGLMKRYPQHGFIGIEPYTNGMGVFLNTIKDYADKNVALHMDDAIPVVHAMRTASIDRLYVLNPDPWPKIRHHKRRIINQEHLDYFTRILKPGGWLVMATDVDDLSEWMVTQCTNHPALQWTAEHASDWQTPPEWWELTTRYAQKGLEAGRRQSYLVFERV